MALRWVYLIQPLSAGIHFLYCKHIQFSLVQLSHSVMSNSSWPHRLQHARPHCLSPTPRIYPNSSPLSWWCHPTISYSVVPFSSCPQSFPASGSFKISQLFTSDGQSIGVSASTSVLPVNTKDWSLLGLTGWISILPKTCHTQESQWFDSVRSVSVRYYLGWHSSSSRISLLSIYLNVCLIIIKTYSRTSLVSQWVIICLPMQGTRVWSLVQEDPTGWGATKPVNHNYWAHTLEPVLHHKRRSHCNEKPEHCNSRVAHLN